MAVGAGPVVGYVVALANVVAEDEVVAMAEAVEELGFEVDRGRGRFLALYDEPPGGVPVFVAEGAVDFAQSKAKCILFKNK